MLRIPFIIGVVAYASITMGCAAMFDPNAPSYIRDDKVIVVESGESVTIRVEDERKSYWQKAEEFNQRYRRKQ